MKIVNTNREGNIVHLEIEESVEVIEKNIQVAFRKLSKNAQLPGFRKGHVPQSLFEKHYGRQVLIEEALNLSLNSAYGAAIDALGLRVVDSPKNVDIDQYKEGQPLVFRCQVDVIPAVTLGTYEGLYLSVVEERVSEEDIDARIDQMLEGRGTFEEVARPIEKGDRVSVDLTATVEGEPFVIWTGAKVLSIGDAVYAASLDEAFVGASVGDEISAEASFDEAAVLEAIRGKTVVFQGKVTRIEGRQKPAFDDAFVQKISKFQTAQAFREDLSQRLRKEAEEKNQERRQEALIDALLEVTSMDLQPVLVEREINHMVSDFESRLKQIRYSLDSYLAASDKTLEEIREGYRDSAVKRLKADLALEAVADAEGIVVTEEMIRDEIRSWNTPDVQTDQEITAYLKKINRESFTELLKRRQALAVLEKKANIQAELVVKGA